MNRRADIDGLRAVAVSGVLVFHAVPSLIPGGSYGVDVFFAISGYLISSHILRDLRTDTFSFWAFYAKRARRLLPSLVIVIAAFLAVGWFVLLPTDYAELGRQSAAGALFVANFFFYHEIGYFDLGARLKPLLHLWSLGVEEQFYLIWPLILLAAFRWKSVARILWMVVLGSLIAAALSAPDAAFYLPWNRFFELGIGALLATLDDGLPRFLCWPGVALIVVAYVHGGVYSPLFGLAATGGAALIIGARRSAFNGRVLSWAPAAYLGRISYQVYLWHWPLLAFARQWMGRPDLSPEIAMALIGLSVALSMTTYHAVDIPLRSLAPLKISATAALSASGAIFLTSMVVISMAGLPFRFSANFAHILSAGQMPDGGWRDGKCFLQPRQYARDWQPSCVPAGRSPLALIWGDSHADMLYYGIHALANRRGYRVGEISASQCPPVPYIIWKSRPGCTGVNQLAIDEIKKVRPSVVFISSTYYPFIPARLWKMAFDVYESLPAKIVFVGFVPEWTLPLRMEVAAKWRKDGSFPFRLAAQIKFPLEQRIKRIAALHSIPYIDPKSIMCDHAGCLTTPDGLHIMQYDQSHLTITGSRFVSAVLERYLP